MKFEQELELGLNQELVISPEDKFDNDREIRSGFDVETDEEADVEGVRAGAGSLYLCATPIGNLEDITYRVLRTLKEVDLIAAEDTRNSIKLLNHFEIKTPMTSYHEFNKYDKAKTLVDKMLKGANIAIITDAGTPGISNPGEELVKQARAAGIKVTSLPESKRHVSQHLQCRDKQQGVSLLKPSCLPIKKRKAVLAELSNETRTMIVYEAPHHLKSTLEELAEVLTVDRRLTICKELTKRHEKSMELTLGEAIEFYKSTDPRGEYVLVIAGKDREQIIKEEQAKWDKLSIKEHVDMYIEKGMDKKEAMKKAASDRGLSKRDIYNQYLKEEQ